MRNAKTICLRLLDYNNGISIFLLKSVFARRDEKGKNQRPVPSPKWANRLVSSTDESDTDSDATVEDYLPAAPSCLATGADAVVSDDDAFDEFSTIGVCLKLKSPSLVKAGNPSLVRSPPVDAPPSIDAVIRSPIDQSSALTAKTGGTMFVIKSTVSCSNTG